MPFKLGLYYSLFSNSKINILLNSGFGYYGIDISERREVKILPIYRYSAETFIRYWEANSNGSVGFHGGIGFEYNISDHLAIVCECQARYVKISNIKGSTNGTKGTLFLYNDVYSRIIPTSEHLDLGIFERKPDPTFDKAVIDLSGFSLRVGIRIKLF